jgi:hypothetical protein
MLAARPRIEYKAFPFSSDANSIDCVESDCELGGAERVGALSVNVTTRLLVATSGWCDCASAALYASPVLRAGRTVFVSVVNPLVGVCGSGV